MKGSGGKHEGKASTVQQALQKQQVATLSLVHRLAVLGEQTWRDTARTEFPLFADIPVLYAPLDTKNPRHWQFWTDGSTTHVDIFKPEVIEKHFRGIIAKMYRKSYGAEEDSTSEEFIQRLMHGCLAYLDFHEQFHPTFCPDSRKDEELVDEALYQGIRAAEPHLQKPDILNKVGHVRNAVWDQLIDGAFFVGVSYPGRLSQRLEDVIRETSLGLSTPHSPLPDIDFTQPQAVPPLPRSPANSLLAALPSTTSCLPDGVVPIFDVIEFEENKKPFPSLFYPLSRALYGMMFASSAENIRVELFDYFKQRIVKQMPEKELYDVVKRAVKGFAKELSLEQLKFARLDQQDFERAVDTLFATYASPSSDGVHEEVVTTVQDLLLDKRSRYDAIRGFIQPLAKYISLQQEEQRPGTHGNGGGSGQSQPGQGQQGNQSGEGQQQGQQGNQPGQGQQGNQPGSQGGDNTEQALINLANILNQQEGNGLLSAVANQQGGHHGGKAQKEKKLTLLATDEYYKRNVPEIEIRSPNYEAVSLDLGKKIIPQYVGSTTLSTQEVAQLDLDGILRFQEQWNIVQLFQISDYEYRFDQYELIEVDETDYTYENTDLELPDNVVLHLDSSGSMGSAMYVGTGQPFDILQHVDYGMLKTLHKAAQEMKKRVLILAVNFSNGSMVSDAVELQQMYTTSNNSAKQIMTGFQGGGTVYSPDTMKQVCKRLQPGRTVHLWITDGGLESGCAPAALQQIEETINQPQTSFLYFEIGGHSSFGSSVEQLFHNRPNAQYYPNVSIQKIKDKALAVLLQYAG